MKCEIIDGTVIKIRDRNEIYGFTGAAPRGKGDDAMVFVQPEEGDPFEVMVRLLVPEDAVETETYLVDLKAKEAWPYGAK